jgi:hypothetical protein
VFGVFVAETPIEIAHALYIQWDSVWGVGESLTELCRQLAKLHHNITVRRKTVIIVNQTGIWYVFMTFSILATGFGQGTNHLNAVYSYGIVG